MSVQFCQFKHSDNSTRLWQWDSVSFSNWYHYAWVPDIFCTDILKKILIETTDLDLCLGVGNLVVLQSPTGIENYSGKANIPIMSYDKPLIPIQSNLKLPDILPEPCEKMSMSIFNGVQLRLIGYEAFDTSCGGVHCNKSGLFFQGQVLPFCGCYQFVSRIAMPGISWKFGLTLKVTLKSLFAI